MRRNRRWTIEEKLTIVLKHLKDGRSMKSLARYYGCSDSLIAAWVGKYNIQGVEGLKHKGQKTIYTTEQKEQMIHEVLNGRSQSEVTRAYGLSTSSLLSSWIKSYTSGNKSTSKGRLNMTKGRKTTLEERLEIVDFALVNNKNYHQTAEKYQVSYQQVYGWVRKYEQEGKDGLLDRRGRKKITPENMTETTHLEAELKETIRQNRRLQMENDYLKKLKEIEQMLNVSR